MQNDEKQPAAASPIEPVVSAANRTILDIFHQSADCGIPPHWCVQYRDEDSAFVDYEYFSSWTKANEYAMQYGYND